MPGESQSQQLLTSGYSFCNFALSSGVGAGALLGAMGDLASCSQIGTFVAIANILAAVLVLPRGGVRLDPPHEDEGGREIGCSHHDDEVHFQEEQRHVAGDAESASLQQVLALLQENASLSVIAFVVFLDFLAEQMLVSLLLLYLSTRFHVSSLQLSLQLMFVGGMASVSLLCVVPALQPKMGDLKLMRLGLLVNAISVGLFAFIWEAWQSFLPPLGCLLSFAVFPTANSLAAAALPRSHGGVAQGVVSGSRTLAEGVSPVLFGWLFQVAEGGLLPGWPFLAAAAAVALALAASFRLVDLRGSGQTVLLQRPGSQPTSSVEMPL